VYSSSERQRMIRLYQYSLHILEPAESSPGENKLLNITLLILLGIFFASVLFPISRKLVVINVS